MDIKKQHERTLAQQVGFLEQRVEELTGWLRKAEERLYAAQRSVDIANWRAYVNAAAIGGVPGEEDFLRYGVSITMVMQSPPATYFWLGKEGEEGA